MSIPLLGAGPTSGSTFTPTDVSGLQVWFKADAGTSSTVDGTALSAWNDQSGNARHLSQGTAANRPVYKTNILNGLPVVRFDGSNDYMLTANWSNPTTVTAFVVVKFASTASTPHVLVHSADAAWSSPYARYCFRLSGAAYQAFIQDGGVSPGNYATGGSADTTSAHVVTIDAQSGAGVNVYVDGASVAGPSTGTTPLTQSNLPLYVGSNQGLAAADTFGGDIGEILVYSAISAANRQSVESYLRSRWGTA